MIVVQPEVLRPAQADLQRLDEADRYLFEKLICDDAEYLDHPSFDQADIEVVLFGGPAVLARDSTYYVEVDSNGLGSAFPLRPADERLLFQKFNYARKQVVRILEENRGAQLTWESMRSVLAWMHRALIVRGQLAQANVALVMAMAKRSRFHGLDTCDVISAGNYALLRSIDRFDCSRGFKFSTYACQGILQRILHVVDSTKRYRMHFLLDFDETLDRDDSSTRRHAAQEEDWVDELRDVLARNRAFLSELEREVIGRRFGLPGSPSDEPMTLEAVGAIIGVTKERVRQIQKRALHKLRCAMEADRLVA